MGVFMIGDFMKQIFSLEEKERQIKREVKATLIRFAICINWYVGFAYELAGRCDIHVAGLPLWRILDTPDVFVGGVIDLIHLI